MSEPLITVVVPLHNHEQWVGNAIDSIVAQDYQNKRIVVVDDGSTDNSLSVVLGKLYKAKIAEGHNNPSFHHGTAQNSNVQVIVAHFDEARGPSFARNAGIKVGWEGTDLFAFLDSDDTYTPDKLSKSAAFFQNKDVGVVYSDFDTLRNDGLRLRQFKEAFGRDRLIEECIVNCDSVVSKTALSKCGMFDENLRVCEDYDLWLRISDHFLLVHIPESLVIVRVGEHSSTSTVAKQTWEQSWQYVRQKLIERTRNAA